MMECILGKDNDKLILALIPVLSVLGTFMVMYSDRKRVKEDPLVGTYKAASELISDVPIGKIKSHEKYIYPHNRRMNFLYFLGIIFIIIGLALTICKIFY
jgi:hypothetical protein